jgi:DNA-binding NarL/FixJ family response regulator
MHDGDGAVPKDLMNDIRVLLIDEGEAPPILQAVSTGRSEQFRITRRPTLSEGLHAMQNTRFDLVLLNLSLPDASTGESVTKTLKAARDVPVIALVNKGETTKAAEALRLGIHDYVLQGCHCDALIQAMRHAIERRQLIADREQALLCTGKTDAQLTAHLSHELRNALACIHQFGTIILDGLAGSVSDEQREYLCIMLENASSMRRVLDSVLEMGHPVPGDEATNERISPY